MHALINHYLPYSILQTSYPDCSRYHGTGLSIQEIGRDREFTDFQISERVFVWVKSKPMIPMFGAYHTIIQYYNRYYLRLSKCKSNTF